MKQVQQNANGGVSPRTSDVAEARSRTIGTGPVQCIASPKIFPDGFPIHEIVLLHRSSTSAGTCPGTKNAKPWFFLWEKPKKARLGKKRKSPGEASGFLAASPGNFPTRLANRGSAAGPHLRSAARSVSRHLTESSPAGVPCTPGAHWEVGFPFDPFLSGSKRSGDCAGKKRRDPYAPT